MMVPLKNIQDDDALYKIIEVNGILDYELNENGEKILICNINDVDYEYKLLGGDDGIFTIGRGASPRPIDSFIAAIDNPNKCGWLKISDVTASNIYLNYLMP